ncbi:MAG: gliding motility-associated C-terminal domain-containing protein [Flavobacteriales bacterium]|nr:gliding motility-associated C-terminal domain-containing protein [Flavobacteriales bacterium]
MLNRTWAPSLFVAIMLAGTNVSAQPCLTGYTLTASPLPTNGTYACGETVTFCFTVTFWNSTNANWFQGIAATFGPGWDLATLTPGAPPATCGGSGGSWGWYNSVQGTAATNIGPTGPGFFFDLNNDGNPGNNFGDFCVGAVNWQFCWTISVLSGPACVNGTGLGVTFNTLSDSQTGSWSSAGCGGDADPPAFTTPVVIQSCTVNAGTPGTLTLCSTSPATGLFNALGGAPNAGGTWTSPSGAAHSGVIDPAVDAPGAYVYTVSSLAPPCSAQATVTVSIPTQPDAGTSGALTICSSTPSLALFNSLGGSPQSGGTWSAPGGAAHSGNFIPGNDAPGTYTYSIAGIAPCVTAVASVDVTVNPTPTAGSNGTLAICSSGPPTPLFGQLGGIPDPGGTWTNASGISVSGTYAPALDVPGTFTYTVAGLPPCAASTATVTVTEPTLPNAGTNGEPVSYCETAGIVQLTSLLGGTPNAGGSWTAPNGANVSGQLDPASAASGTYTYSVAGTAPCPNAQASVAITILQQPDAGGSATINLCDASPNTDLFTALAGSPDGGGTWAGPAGAPEDQTFTPGVSLPGGYTYTITAPAPCVNASATVTVNVSAQPNAGTSGTLLLCSTGAPTSLLPSLGTSAQAGGTWTTPSGAVFNGTFVPGSSANGDYTYTVGGVPPCGSSSATVAVSTVQPNDPGTNGTLSLCSSGAATNLFPSVEGTPMAGGTWTSPNGIPMNGTVDPATGVGGTYQYTVPANGPCPAGSSTVNVSIVPAANAGTSGTTTLCSSQTAAYTLITGLGGIPALNGTWTAPNGQPHGNSFNIGSDATGAYMYTVNGTAPCPSVSSTVTMNVVQAPVAGTNSSITVCAGDAAFDPYTQLSGSPATGGTWTTPAGGTTTLIDPSTAVSGTYTYTVSGTAPCPNAQAQLSVTISPLPNAGEDAATTVCINGTSFNLFALLGATAQAGGTWSGPSGNANSTFVPGTTSSGTYTYTVLGSEGCSGITEDAIVIVTVAPLPVPSFSANITSGCTPLPVQFTYTGPNGLQSANWSFGDGNSSNATGSTAHTYTTGGQFNVSLTVTDGNGCSGSSTLSNAMETSSGPAITFLASPFRASVQDPVFQVEHAPSENVQYSWTLSDQPLEGSSSFELAIQPAEVGIYTLCLTGMDGLGCSNTNCLDLFVEDVLTIHVPNAFTPNGDEINDLFLPNILGVDPTSYQLLIFDRWGLEVFSSTDPMQAWNGKLNNTGAEMPLDVYVWRIIARDQFSAARKDLFGTVTLLK